MLIYNLISFSVTKYQSKSLAYMCKMNYATSWPPDSIVNSTNALFIWIWTWLHTQFCYAGTTKSIPPSVECHSQTFFFLHCSITADCKLISICFKMCWWFLRRGKKRFVQLWTYLIVMEWFCVLNKCYDTLSAWLNSTYDMMFKRRERVVAIGFFWCRFSDQ